MRWQQPGYCEIAVHDEIFNPETGFCDIVDDVFIEFYNGDFKGIPTVRVTQQELTELIKALERFKRI